MLILAPILCCEDLIANMVSYLYRLCGFPPFYDESNEALFSKIRSADFDFPSPYWDDISDMAKDLISQLLVVEPAQRMDGEGIMSHPWIKGEGTPRKELPTVLGEIKKFNARRKFRKVASVVMVGMRWKKLTE